MRDLSLLIRHAFPENLKFHDANRSFPNRRLIAFKAKWY